MKNIKRFFVILRTLFPPFFAYVWAKNKPESKKYLDACTSIRTALQNLGPTYIKFGQMLSARPDLIGMNLSNELRNLLDHEPIIAFEEVEEVIEEELKKPTSEIYKKIEHSPIGTASIGQVHKAVLLNGHPVAIKVQRPGIQKIIQEDLPVLKSITHFMDIFLGGKGLKFSYIYSQFADWISHELNFQIEGHRSEKIRENMKEIEGISIPKIYWDYSGAKVLTMDYLEGYTINELLELMRKQKIKTLYDIKVDYKIDPDIVIKRLIRAVAKQALVDKFFHGDLHPANIIVGRHNVIGFIDFGIVGSLNEEEHTQILMAMIAIVEGDPEALVKVITGLIVEPLSAQELSEIHQSFADELHKLHEDIGGKITLNHALTLLFPLSEKYHVMWSAGFLLAAKTIGQLDAVAGLIGLRTSLVELMKPEVERALAISFPQNFSKEALFKNLMEFIQTGKKLPQTLSELEELIHTSDLTKLGQAVTSSQRHAFRNSILLGSAALLAVPFLSNPSFSSISKPVFFIGLPLLFIVILVTLFTSRKK